MVSYAALLHTSQHSPRHLGDLAQGVSFDGMNTGNFWEEINFNSMNENCVPCPLWTSEKVLTCFIY